MFIFISYVDYRPVWNFLDYITTLLILKLMSISTFAVGLLAGDELVVVVAGIGDERSPSGAAIAAIALAAYCRPARP